MAGTAILKNKTANLNTPQQSTSANIQRRCLCLEQPKVVEQNNDNTKDRLMHENSTNYCKNSSFKFNRVLTNNYNKKIQKQQRPLTLCLVIIMSLTIVLIQMPTMALGKAISRELTLEITSAGDAKSASSSSSSASSSSSHTSAETDILLLLSSEDEEEEDVLYKPKNNNLALDSEASLNSLTSLDVLKHVQHTQQHQAERRTRLRKRHTGDLVITKYLDENSHNLEWKNPCNVAFQNSHIENGHVSKQQVYHYLHKFHESVTKERDTIEQSTNVIKISDIKTWNKHKDAYTFLPKLNRTGSIPLSRWYRNMQTYLAAFGYLARTQYNFDMKKQGYAGDTSEELNKLLISARLILCELETTINGSSSNDNNLEKLKTISREAMNNRLQGFRTKQDALLIDIVAANTVDLKFTKHFYFKYLQNMRANLNRRLKNKGKKSAFSEENYSASVVNSQVVTDDGGSININSLMKNDYSLMESVEVLPKPTQRPHNKKSHRSQRRKSAELPEM